MNTTTPFLKPFLKMSVMHLFVPRVVAIILVILGVMILIQRAQACKKNGKPFINFKGYRFFEPGYDKVKFWGSVILFVLYIASLPIIHFVPAGILFVTLYNILYTNCINLQKIFKQKNAHDYGLPMVNVKDLIISVIIGVIMSVFLWVLFYKLFNITLP